MSKTPASWSSNPEKDTPVVSYSDSSVTYNSSSTLFSAVSTALDEWGKQALAWAGVSKTQSDWSGNPSAEANLLTYDTFAAAYDTASATYDNIVSGDQADTEKVPAVWSIA